MRTGRGVDLIGADGENTMKVRVRPSDVTTESLLDPGLYDEGKQDIL